MTRHDDEKTSHQDFSKPSPQRAHKRHDIQTLSGIAERGLSNRTSPK